MVSGGLLPTEPDAFGSVGGFPLLKPEQSDLIIKPKTSSNIRRFFDENIQKSAIFGVLLQEYVLGGRAVGSCLFFKQGFLDGQKLFLPLVIWACSCVASNSLCQAYPIVSPISDEISS